MSGVNLVGLISSTDILRSSYSDVFVGSNNSTNESLDHTVKVEDIMQKEVISLKDTDTVRHAAEILMKNQFNSIPVVTQSKELVGIVTSKDLIGYLASQY